jgi:hypothetical protein
MQAASVNRNAVIAKGGSHRCDQCILTSQFPEQAGSTTIIPMPSERTGTE